MPSWRQRLRRLGPQIDDLEQSAWCVRAARGVPSSSDREESWRLRMDLFGVMAFLDYPHEPNHEPAPDVAEATAAVLGLDWPEHEPHPRGLTLQQLRGHLNVLRMELPHHEDGHA